MGGVGAGEGERIVGVGEAEDAGFDGGHCCSLVVGEVWMRLIKGGEDWCG